MLLLYIAGLVLLFFLERLSSSVREREFAIYSLYSFPCSRKFSSKLKSTTKRSNPPWILVGRGWGGGALAEVACGLRGEGTPPPLSQQRHLPWKPVPPGRIGATSQPARSAREREKNSGRRAACLFARFSAAPHLAVASFGRREADAFRETAAGGGPREGGGSRVVAAFDISFTRSHVSLTPTLVAEPR